MDLKQLEYRGYDSAGIAVLDPKTGIILKEEEQVRLRSLQRQLKRIRQMQLVV